MRNIVLRDGKNKDWDELLCGEIPIIGRDFELLVRSSDLELFRGPMGTVQRVGDDLLFQPVLVVVWKHGDPDQHIARPSSETAPRVRLIDHRLVELPDTTLVIADRVRQSPLYCLHAPGDNITPPNLGGLTAQG